MLTTIFIELAACVLWERLLPERPSFEILDERMQAGYAAFWANDMVRACDHWLAVWERFKPHFGPEMTRVRDVDAIFHGSEYFFNWCQEFENKLGNAGVHDPHCWRARIRRPRRRTPARRPGRTCAPTGRSSRTSPPRRVLPGAPPHPAS